MIEIVAMAKMITAIENLGGVDGVWISITDLDEVMKMDVAEFDATMIKLAGQFSIICAPEDNQKTIKHTDHAVIVGGTPCHLVTIA